MILPFVVALAACAQGQASPEASPATTVQESCWDSATTTVAMVECSRRDLEELEALLRLVEDGVAERVPSGSRGALIETMREWKQLRDKDCAVLGSFFEGGSIRPVRETACRADRTRDRILFLLPMLCPGAGIGELCDEAETVRRAAEAIRGPA